MNTDKLKKLYTYPLRNRNRLDGYITFLKEIQSLHVDNLFSPLYRHIEYISKIENTDMETLDEMIDDYIENNLTVERVLQNERNYINWSNMNRKKLEEQIYNELSCEYLPDLSLVEPLFDITEMNEYTKEAYLLNLCKLGLEQNLLKNTIEELNGLK